MTGRANLSGLEVAPGAAGHQGIESGLMFLDSSYISDTHDLVSCSQQPMENPSSDS